MSKNTANNQVKSTVDVEKGIIAIGILMHGDLEDLLLEHGSEQGNLWGINLYPLQAGTFQFIDFDCILNIRPGMHNKSRSVENAQVREQRRRVVAKLVK